MNSSTSNDALLADKYIMLSMYDVH